MAVLSSELACACWSTDGGAVGGAMEAVCNYVCFNLVVIFYIFLKFYHLCNLKIYLLYILRCPLPRTAHYSLLLRFYVIFFFLAQAAIVSKAGEQNIKSSQSNPKIQQLRLCFPSEPRVQRFGRLTPSPLTIATGRPW